MKFLIGTQNQEKIATAREVLKQVIGEAEHDLEGVDVSSGYGETPIGEQTKLGAYNRAQALMQSHDCDYAIGVESGLVERYGDTYEEAWCAVLAKDGVTYGYSSGLTIPRVLLEKMNAENIEHFEALRTEEIKALLPIKHKKDTWANYSALMIARRVSFEEAIRNALVPRFAPKDSLYHK